MLRYAQDNNLAFKLYKKSIDSNTKTNNTLLKLVNKNLSRRTCVRRGQHVLVRTPF